MTRSTHIRKGEEHQDDDYDISQKSLLAKSHKTDRVVRQHSKKTVHHITNSAPQRKLLPWEAFLPTGGQDMGNEWSDTREPNKNDFKELLDEGKKRLEQAEQEQQLRERAEVVGAMGALALEDLLADLREPSFSRQQNEKLRQGIAKKLRAKVARLFGRVMSQYVTGSYSSVPCDSNTAESGMARASAAFRVKLNRLLDHAYLGEIQHQVTHEIAGATRTPTTRTRPRECCKNVVRNGSGKGGQVGSRREHVSTTGARIDPRPPPRQPSTTVPVVPRQRGRRRPTLPAKRSPGRHGTTGVRETHPRKEGLGSTTRDQQDDPEEQRNDGGCDGCADATPALGRLGSSDEDEESGCSSDTPSSRGVSSGESTSSGDSFDCYDGTGASQGSSDYSSSSSSQSDGGGLPASPKRNKSEMGTTETCHDESQQAAVGDDELPGEATVEEVPEEEEEDEEKDKVDLPNGITKRHSCSTFMENSRQKQHRGKKHKRRRRRLRGGGSGANSAHLDEGWSNRWLTVILTELGLHQSQQRTVLSKHIPDTFKDDSGAGQAQPVASPLSRIDRPHFSPAFVELRAAGEGCTLLMCPEPVAPGYEYSDVFEEVVKLHPPVGQLILEEIDKGNIMTRSDALAHVESLERGAVPNNAKRLVDEFLAEKEVKNLLASAETIELDLAQCAAAGTLLNQDDVL